MTELQRMLAAAIQARQCVSASYGGYVREMCPHAIGWKDRKEHCLFYQFGGGSKSGLPPGGEWRCLLVAQLREVRVYAGAWHSRADYWNRVTCIDSITAQVH